MCEIEQIAKILGSTGQFLFGLVAVGISLYALLTKRKDVFKSELAKSQFSEMGIIRMQLSEIFFDIAYVQDFKSQLENMQWSLEDFKSQCPEQWEQFQRYKNNSISLFYKLMTPDYYLIPEWIDVDLFKNHFEVMKSFAPFTVVATGNKKISEVESYQMQIQQLIKHIDIELKKNA